ncbi:Tfp pilus assembly protein FimT/FimU [Aerosakkonemataceae cyanobacterium BLCC-F50]|uniref:Tfp pilus assembly protein FimT/FimU n=1 Tax=Floridaenema flaviceps BLCC-F50 TaxID=3153642 RepID=A0ABV4XUY3_9CYAN
MKPYSKQTNDGFTMVEMIVVVVIIGILSAIVAPSWLQWLTRQRVNTAQAEAVMVLREAQSNAKREKRVWQACFRDTGTKVQWSVQPQHPDDGNNNRCLNPGQHPNAGIAWNDLASEDADKIAIDSANTTLSNAGSNTYSVLFQYKGLLKTESTQTGGITFGTRDNQGSLGVRAGTKRCVAVMTIMGATSAGSDNDCPTLVQTARRG